MGDIFVSYAREDKARVAMLVEALAARGWSVWWDVELPLGREFDRSIAEALQSARCVVVVWSRASVASRWVLDEAHHGRERGILVPVRIDEVAPPLFFNRLQAADLVGWKGEGGDPEIRKLVTAVGGVLGRPAHNGTDRKPPEAQDAGRIRRAPINALSAVTGFGSLAFATWFIFGGLLFAEAGERPVAFIGAALSGALGLLVLYDAETRGISGRGISAVMAVCFLLFMATALALWLSGVM